MVDSQQRGLVVLRGTRTQTARDALRVVGRLQAVVWVGAADGVQVPVVSHRQVRHRLGDTVDGAVVDLHEGLAADAVGQVHGMVRGGGVMVLRLPAGPLPERSGRWFERCLSRSKATCAARDWTPPGSAPLNLSDQDRLVGSLCRVLGDPGVSVVTADRGRGKSVGVGRALATLPPDVSVQICGPNPAAVVELLAASGRPAGAHVDPLELLDPADGLEVPEVVVVDEAAQVPVGLLQALVQAHPTAHVVLATTVHGYEGTGRGFQHRLLPWLHTLDRPVVHHTLEQPIRWGPEDHLERFIFELLALDAAPAVDVRRDAPAHVALLDRDSLVDQPQRLHEVFGLLVAAHYRTTPGDLQRLLDLPHVALHGVWMDGRVVAVGWLLREGELSAAEIAAAQRGCRPTGHALAETLICHSGQPAAGELKIWRSVRTAVHPSLRRRGLARALIAHQHATHREADLIGTMFGGAAEVVKMRRVLGYQVVRVGLSRNARTGTPSVVMLRPVSDTGARLVRTLRADLARDLPGLLNMLDRERGVGLPPALVMELQADLPPPSAWTPARMEAAVARLVAGGTQLDAVGAAPRLWLDALEAAGVDWRAMLAPRERAAVEGRVVAQLPWHSLGFASVRVAQRAVRRGIVGLWRRVGGATGRS